MPSLFQGSRSYGHRQCLTLSRSLKCLATKISLFSTTILSTVLELAIHNAFAMAARMSCVPPSWDARSGLDTAILRGPWTWIRAEAGIQHNNPRVVPAFLELQTPYFFFSSFHGNTIPVLQVLQCRVAHRPRHQLLPQYVKILLFLLP
jgi:hypothetical protein